MWESVGSHFIIKSITWCWDRLKSAVRADQPNNGTEPKEPEPSILDQVQRFKRVMAAHDLRPEHWSRFFKESNAPFNINKTDQVSNEALLFWLDDEKVDWLCKTFLISRGWMDGEDYTGPHEFFTFSKDPKRFFDVVSEEFKFQPNARDTVYPTAYFVLNERKQDAEHIPTIRLFVAIAFPICHLSKEVSVFRYIYDDPAGGYPWHSEPYRTQLRIMARLCFKQFKCHVVGYSMPPGLFDKVQNGKLMVPEALNRPQTRGATWHPDDYGLGKPESMVAKDTESLDKVLTWMKELGLPHSDLGTFEDDFNQFKKG